MSTQRVCTVAVSSPERGGGHSIGDSMSRMQPEQCPCGDVHPPDRLHHIAAKVLEVENILDDIVANAHLVQSRLRRLAVLTAVWVTVPRPDRGVRPPLHHRAVWIFKPRCLVNSRLQDSHLCARLSAATSSSAGP